MVYFSNMAHLFYTFVKILYNGWLIRFLVVNGLHEGNGFAHVSCTIVRACLACIYQLNPYLVEMNYRIRINFDLSYITIYFNTHRLRKIFMHLIRPHTFIIGCLLNILIPKLMNITWKRVLSANFVHKMTR